MIIEQEAGVDTRIVEVDFLDDFFINDKLMDIIKSIDIGILGKEIFVLILFMINKQKYLNLYIM